MRCIDDSTIISPGPVRPFMRILTNVLACHKEAVLVEVECTSVAAADVDLSRRSLYFLMLSSVGLCLLIEGLTYTEDAAHRLHDEVLVHRKTRSKSVSALARRRAVAATGKAPAVQRGVRKRTGPGFPGCCIPYSLYTLVVYPRCIPSLYTLVVYCVSPVRSASMVQ